MKCLLSILVFLFFSVDIKADDILISFGQNLAGAPSWKYKGGGTNLDGILWKDPGYGEPGWVTGNSALGFGSNPPVRNTVIPQNATAGGGGATGARYPTLYFRKLINISDPGSYNSFKISAKFDDGIVIWVNGVEAFRNNIIANPAYADLATVAISGNGSVVYNTTVSTSMFVPGDNIIAVEIHQNAVNSSDLFFDMELTGIVPVLTRGPYLQAGKQDSITIRWRTDIATDSKVTWGTAFGNYTNSFELAALTTEHIVRIGGLTADIKYWYTIGTSGRVLQGTNTNYFLTLPRYNTTRKLRFLAIGDCGNASTNQVDVKNTFINYIGTNDVDAMILLGDNAYSFGLDTEFQTGFFDIYKNDLLKYYKLYPAPGNHDYGNSSANTGSRTMPYHQIFTVPMAGEIGGVPSGVSNYYSFDIGDVHFISLDSYGKDDANTTNMYDTSGQQATWLKADLTANTKKWTIAYFHHPPYTKTTHTSDTETDLIAIRERFIRILERNGVDLILCGHSHGYERSYLLKNYYRTVANPFMDSSFKFIYHTATGNDQNGKYDGTANSCSYNYNSGNYNHGSMYIVAGSAGQIGGTSPGYPHDCMYYSNATNGGCFYFEVDSNRLDGKFISYNTAPAPVIRDQFSIFKDVNRVQDITLLQNTPLNLTASWRGSYLWPNNGSATTQGVTINTGTIGTYNYIVHDANNCLKDSFHVVVTIPLPVSVISFAATLNKDIVLLDWSTSQEIDNKFFTVERSTDGNSFSFLGNVNGAGTSSLTNKYYLYDLQPADGVNYYRLSQTGIDGVKKNIEVKRVTYQLMKDFSSTILNAGNGTINITIHNVTTGMIRMKVVDILGREVLIESFNAGPGNVTRSIQLNKGVYVLSLINGAGQMISTKIIAD